MHFHNNDLQNGVYFYSIISNGKNLTTKKMIVKK
ncbi:MAG TPA: T9SS type A sorting domain-containing protein [Bacteroidales bacterium]|nr:T9SS type A sorting domain-containing protein [Bacteroidales bacterium]